MVTDFIGITGAKGLIVISSKFGSGALLFIEKEILELTEYLFSENFMPVKEFLRRKKNKFSHCRYKYCIIAIDYISKMITISINHSPFANK